MKSPKAINRILDSTALSTGMFLTSSCYKTYKDYKTASPKYKDRFLTKDCVVLSGAALGMFAFHTTSKHFTNSKMYNQIITNISKKVNKSGVKNGIKTSIQYTTDIVKELASSFLSTTAGILGALGSDYLLSKTSFKQPKYKDFHPDKTKFSTYIDNNLSKITNENTRDIIYTSVSDLPKVRIIASSMLGADAIELAKDKEFDKRLENTTKYLINDTLIPLIFLSTSSALTKNLSLKKRIPIIFFSLFFGILGIQKLQEKLTKSK